MEHSSYQILIISMHSIMSYFKTMAYCSRLCTYPVNLMFIQRYVKQIFRKNKTLNKLTICSSFTTVTNLLFFFSILNSKTISCSHVFFSDLDFLVYVFQISQIDTFFPVKGPIAGNTMVTVTGQNFHIGSNVSVMIGQTPCDIQR